MKTIKLKPPMVPEGWLIESDIAQKSFVPRFALHLEPEQEHGLISGELLRERLKDKLILSAAVLDYLLANPHLIPDEWKKDGEGNTRYIFFWGTVYRCRDGVLFVRYLSWVVGRWRWGFCWLDYSWHSISPAAVRASLSSGTEKLNSGTASLELSALESRVATLEAIVKKYNLTL